MYFDSHAHLDEACFAEDFEEILARMAQNQVRGMMNIGCDLPSSERSIRLAERYDWIWAAVGSHPDDADQVDEARILMYRKLARHSRVKAIGEIGLDYHYEDIPRDVQQHAFRLQMALAEELELPVVIHEREAHGDALTIIDEYPSVKGMFHCFSGSVEMAEELLKLGWMLSFNGAITFKNARKAPEVIAAVPLERMMVETDAPYLTPVPFRGKRNDSGYVHLVAEKIAQLKGLPAEQVERQTWENGVRFFGIPQE